MRDRAAANIATCAVMMIYNLGAKLLSAEVHEAPDVEDIYGVHEVAFFVVTTSLGAFTIETHNEQDGYYGGFQIEATIVAL